MTVVDENSSLTFNDIAERKLVLCSYAGTSYPTLVQNAR